VGRYRVPVHFYSFFEWPAFQCFDPYAVRTSFLCLGGGRTFQNVQSFTPCTPVVEPNIRFAISCFRGFLEHLSDVLFIRRRSCLESRQFIFLLYAERNRCFFPNVLDFECTLPTLFLPGPLRMFHFRTAGTARSITRFRDPDSFCRDPTLYWVRFFAPLRRRTTKRRYPDRSSDDPMFSAFISFSRLYSSPSIIRFIKSKRTRWAGNVARMGEMRNMYRLLVGKPEGKRPLGRPRRR
jgi:hypothetical protein